LRGKRKKLEFYKLSTYGGKLPSACCVGHFKTVEEILVNRYGQRILNLQVPLLHMKAENQREKKKNCGIGIGTLDLILGSR
jgi:hypothetical protein